MIDVFSLNIVLLTFRIVSYSFGRQMVVKNTKNRHKYAVYKGLKIRVSPVQFWLGPPLVKCLKPHGYAILDIFYCLIERMKFCSFYRVIPSFRGLVVYGSQKNALNSAKKA